ncbi:MAG: YfhO family protein [Verrucomicrobiia bacterium]
MFTSRPVVLSDSGTDLASQFIYWRAFTADQLRHGHLPLWNPHVYCGTPYLGWAQTAVLYPTNGLDLVLPLPRSINLGIALHVFLAGLFTYLWGLRRGLHPVAAVMAGALFMFSGSYFLHVYAGHLSLLYAIAWTPLVFVSVDEWIRTRTLGWVLSGMAAITMQILAGDFQACFYTAVAAGLLMLFGLIGSRHRTAVLLGFLGMYAGAAALGAVQFLTSLQAVSESIRGGGITYQFARTFSFPPENLLTALGPGFFGNGIDAPYWGRWTHWETCLFVGVSGLALAVYGSVCGRRELRRGLIPLLAIMLVLALGANTPLFEFLYYSVPGFDRFRANAKFIIEASLFMVMLAGTGLDRLLGDPRGNKWLALGLFVAGIIVVCGALQLRSAALAPEPANWWTRAMQPVHPAQESFLPAASYADPTFVRQAGGGASRCLFVAAVELLVLSVLLSLAGASRWVVYATALMAIAEVFVFGRTSLATFDLAYTEAPKLKAFLDRRPGDYRIFYQQIPNVAMWLGKEDVWGYAPLTLKRYTEFMAFTQGQPAERDNQYVEFSRFHPLYAMLRWRYAFLANKDGDQVVTGNAVMPHLQLLQQYHVMSGRDEILQAMDSPSFDPRQQVILETEPDPAPQPSAENGTVTLTDSSANQLTVEADLPHPAILLITDAYSDGWRARPLAGSAQHAYDVLPANYVLQAIPLSQGHHHIQIEYAPIGFRMGTWISILSLAGFIVATALYVRRRRPQPQSVLVP